MDADWITSPSARRVQQHEGDSRPAWLWSQDGQSLLWQNAAAPLFLAKLKKHGLKLAPLAVPIKGQIARNIRLGSVGRTSLARIQFIAGDKPASSTCATTPLVWQDGQTALLVVGVDPIASDILAAAAAEADAEAPESIETPAEAEAEWQGAPTPDTEADLAAAQGALAEPDVELPEPAHHADGASIDTDENAYARELENWRDAELDGKPVLELVEPGVSDEPEPVPAAGSHLPPAGESTPAEDVPAPEGEVGGEVEAPESGALTTSRLSRLVDRLAADDALFSPLTDADDNPPPGSGIQAAPAAGTLFKVTGRGFVPRHPGLEQTDAEADLADLAALEPEADGETQVEPAPPAPLAEDEALESLAKEMAELAPVPAADIEAVERVSRYNFDELSRILTDRIGDAAPPAKPPVETPRGGALINLGGETLVLNRLPLGILVFRDQQVLFANRAITEMVGYESVESLRAAGLAAVFPAAGPEGQDAGPVNHLVQRDGTLVPVTARLQSISWQGRPALMLSASTTEVRTSHEAAVSAFAQTFADMRGDGFLEATRAGVISAATPRSAGLLRLDGPLEGKALSTLVAASDVASLREFLERPARFAETARPCLTLRSASGTAEITLFGQGQAGVITGYFGFVRGREPAPLRLAGPSDADPTLLARISRGVRRPLNTIIGFSDLIRSEAFGALKNERYESYAQDIANAGQEIAALVDELDDYARLRDGRYLPQRASIELTGLLESCVIRIRQQASGARVILRNAISENLPRITADRASLAQAVLNLLASAIDQTPTGGAVVISAQREDDGGIAVHVRDSSTNAVDMAERFVVFRDGMGKDGQLMSPVRSSVGLALTRSLLAVNAFSLSVDPAGEQGMLFTLIIPADLVERPALPQPE
ncbi:histidine kinase dimerization/phospho-acceptor domain-containing protein [Devosia sp.]|uniref:sensor histidine kinase n=1 Tax=Devosia sp. TaxID=1871048 RepID=UPI00292CF2E9|nr:histidine kinase dimerization/phospho-acceptor domain-containing protein [Devosia sp.]